MPFFGDLMASLKTHLTQSDLIATLEDQYNRDGDGEHPAHTRADWRRAVRDEETLSGYWEWVAHKLLSDE